MRNNGLKCTIAKILMRKNRKKKKQKHNKQSNTTNYDNEWKKIWIGTPLHHLEVIISIDESAMRSDVEVLHNINKNALLIRDGFWHKIYRTINKRFDAKFSNQFLSQYYEKFSNVIHQCLTATTKLTNVVSF